MDLSLFNTNYALISTLLSPCVCVCTCACVCVYLGQLGSLPADRHQPVGVGPRGGGRGASGHSDHLRLPVPPGRRALVSVLMPDDRRLNAGRDNQLDMQ